MPAYRRNAARATPSPKPAPRLYDPKSRPMKAESASSPTTAHGENRTFSSRAAFTMSMGFKREQRPGLYCVELRTDRWEEAVKWYRETLGLRVLVRVPEDGYALFEAGETRLSLLARRTAGEASPRWSLGFEVIDLDSVSKRLLIAGSPVTRPRDNAEGFQEIITSDPDGNTIRLFAWPMG
jgi:predicted enzyme related to lactoylglutathione lyase